MGVYPLLIAERTGFPARVARHGIDVDCQIHASCIKFRNARSNGM